MTLPRVARAAFLPHPILISSGKSDDQRQRLKEFDLSLEAEFQGMRRLDGLRCVARVLRPGRCEINLRGDTLLVPYIVQEYVRGPHIPILFDATVFSAPHTREKGKAE